MHETVFAKALKLGFDHAPHFARRALIKSMITRAEIHCYLKSTQLKIPKNHIVGRKEVLRRLGGRRNDVCHILGSGWSLIDGLQKISTDDTVYTCNMGGLLNIDYDLWFVEFAKFGNDRIGQISLLQRQVIEARATSIKNIIFKNIWQDKLDWNYINKNYQIPYAILKDVHFPISPSRVTSEELIEELLFPPRDIVLQHSSTVLTMILFAFWHGFKEIVVHGLDGEGRYYFQKDETVIPDHLSTSFRSLFPYSDDAMEKRHQSNDLVGPFILDLRKKMEDFGVLLQCAAPTSPLSRYLDVR